LVYVAFFLVEVVRNELVPVEDALDLKAFDPGATWTDGQVSAAESASQALSALDEAGLVPCLLPSAAGLPKHRETAYRPGAEVVEFDLGGFEHVECFPPLGAPELADRCR